eukprot:6173547-Pleurochrysis_carterae.AAC.1
MSFAYPCHLRGITVWHVLALFLSCSTASSVPAGFCAQGLQAPAWRSMWRRWARRRAARTTGGCRDSAACCNHSRISREDREDEAALQGHAARYEVLVVVVVGG